MVRKRAATIAILALFVALSAFIGLTGFATSHRQRLPERDHYGHIHLRRRANGQPDISPY